MLFCVIASLIIFIHSLVSTFAFSFPFMLLTIAIQFTSVVFVISSGVLSHKMEVNRVRLHFEMTGDGHHNVLLMPGPLGEFEDEFLFFFFLFFLLKAHFGDIAYFIDYKTEFFSFQHNLKDLDPSCKMDLDLWDCLGRVKLVL